MDASADVCLALTRDDLLAIERAAVHAWPASETQNIAGWLWRYSGGASQRANSVSTLAFDGADTIAAIEEAEELYFCRGAVSRFQVGTELAAPADLDLQLERRGYRLEEPVTTLARRLGQPSWPAGIEITAQPTAGWMEVYLSNIAPNRHAAAPAILDAVPAPRAFLSYVSGGQVVSTALAVLHDHIVIAECVGTRAEARRTGGARKVMAALEAWGSARGARIAALQAVAANEPAQRFYAALGYRKVNGYHYRVRDC